MAEGNADSKGGSGKFWVMLLVGIAMVIFGIWRNEPCILVLGIVIAAAGFAILGILSGAFIRKVDD